MIWCSALRKPSRAGRRYDYTLHQISRVSLQLKAAELHPYSHIPYSFQAQASEKKVLTKSRRSTKSQEQKLKEKYNDQAEKAKEQRKKTVGAEQRERKDNNSRERAGTALGLSVIAFNNLQGPVITRGNVDFDSLSVRTQTMSLEKLAP
ncbi:hypothetical protein DM02DRAFT_685699 [Periconia macrospinosa]|uniref:Uncharacterized protein n=1 Tax=Periconia macrospinosa TaxID=97972 RepID=A0A2V1DGJ9_9PLEO|nr:hypothetical protein DM02DRAFT_685699 [Periconia macrospinosa]